MVYRLLEGCTCGFCCAESIVWNHSSAQEKTRVDLLALSSLELHFTIEVARKVATGRLERPLRLISRAGREVAHSKTKN